MLAARSSRYRLVPRTPRNQAGIGHLRFGGWHLGRRCPGLGRWFSVWLLITVGWLLAGCDTTPQPAIRRPAAPVRTGPAKGDPFPVVRRPIARSPLPLSYYLIRHLDLDGSQPVGNAIVTTYQLRCAYPEFTHPDFAPLNQAILDLVDNERRLLKDQAGLLDDSTLGTANLPGKSTMRFEVVFATNDFISLCFEVVYAEGVLGRTKDIQLTTLNYSAGRQMFLTLEDCLATPQAMERLRRKMNEARERYPKTGEPAEKEFVDLFGKVFCITPKALVLYDLDPSATEPGAGIMRQETPWSEIRELLDTKFIEHMQPNGLAIE